MGLTTMEYLVTVHNDCDQFIEFKFYSMESLLEFIDGFVAVHGDNNIWFTIKLNEYEEVIK